MLGKIIQIEDGQVIVKLDINIYETGNLVGKNVIFEDGDTKIVGEIINAYSDKIKVNLDGEIIENNFVYGDIIKPSFRSVCRVITRDELDIMFSINTDDKGVFCTSLENEYALMGCALERMRDEQGRKKYQKQI